MTLLVGLTLALLAVGAHDVADGVEDADPEACEASRQERAWGDGDCDPCTGFPGALMQACGNCATTCTADSGLGRYSGLMLPLLCVALPLEAGRRTCSTTLRLGARGGVCDDPRAPPKGVRCRDERGPPTAGRPGAQRF